MAIPYPTDPSLPANPSPLFSDSEAARGDHLRGNNAQIWANLTYIVETILANAVLSTDGTFTANSDLKLPTEKASKTYISNYTSHPVTVLKNASYVITDSDGYQRIEVDTSSAAVTITLPLMANNRGRRIEISFIKNDSSADVVTISPNATDANKISGDSLASIILPKVGDHVILQESVNSGCWEIVDEKITSQLRLNTWAGYGSSDTMIMKFTNVAENIGNMFSENHVSGYSSGAEGLKITILKSGKYSFTHSVMGETSVSLAAGLSLNSDQRSTNIFSITKENRLAGAKAQTTNNFDSVSFTGYFKAGDVIRPHAETPGIIPKYKEVCNFTCTYLGR